MTEPTRAVSTDTGPQRGGAASFGDVTGEYLALRGGAGVVTDWHELVWVSGPDAVKFLDGLLSQAVQPMAIGAVSASLLLAPQGKLRAPHRVLRGEEEVGLLADPGVAATVAQDLARFKIRVDAVIGTEVAPVVDVWGPEAARVVTGATGFVAPASGWVRHGEVVVAAVPFSKVPLPRYVVVGVPAADLVASPGAVRCGRLAADAVRIEAGEPVMGVDIDERTIPQEADLVADAVDFTKGCYLGQELVARIDSRGHVNRHLRGLIFEANVLPPLGAELYGDSGEDAKAVRVADLARRIAGDAGPGRDGHRPPRDRAGQPGHGPLARWHHHGSGRRSPPRGVGMRSGMARRRVGLVAILTAVMMLTACSGNRTEGRFGAELYGVSCAGCHGGEGAGSGAAPALDGGSNAASLTDEQLIAVMRVGPGSMPAFTRLSDEQVASLIEHIRSLQ